MENAHTLPGNKIALLIDFDNVILGVEDPGFDVELVVNAMRSRGVVVLGRAYGDWYRHHRHRRKLMEQGIELVETPVFGPVIKNSADIRIVLDGFEIAMSQGHIDTFCLVSGDSDFLPLIKKLQFLGKNVIVIAGQKFTSELVRRNCNEYIAYENLFAESMGATEDLGSIEGAYALLDRAINTLNERLMDVRSSTVKQMMLQLNPAFNERAFGCNQFKQFLDRATRANIVRLGERDHVSGEYSVFLANEREDTGPATEAGTEGPHRIESGPGRNGNPRNEPSRSSTRRFPARSRRGSAEAAAEETTTAAAPTNESSEIAGRPTPTTVPANVSPIDADMPQAPIVNVLAARTNLRRGRLRFTAKDGRSSIVPAGQTTGAGSVEAGKPEAGAGDAQQGTAQGAAEAEAATMHPEPTPVPSEIAAATGHKGAAPDAAELADELNEAARTGAARKRGSRGGRRQKKTGAEGEAAEAEAGPGTAPSANAVVQLSPEATALGDTIAAAPAADKATEAAANAAQEGDAAASAKPARVRRTPVRRASTRTKKAPVEGGETAAE